MEKSLIKWMLLIILSGSLSCKKENKEVNRVSMFINFIGWRDDEGKALIDKSSSLLTVTGTNSHGTLQITVPDVKNSGTYDLVLGSGQPGLVFLDRKSGMLKTYSISQSKPFSRGSITITDITTGNENSFYATGTFSGVAYYTSSDSIIITHGTFQHLN
jgi:hypothetical protein